ncbi:MAG: type III-A CRISPR-associated RAMP protein Csm5 [Planctomycetota bacterium]|nr:MAG: type III-A CRISPR-associated RAMP protein Csm5 [Planctomycetota bacterium]
MSIEPLSPIHIGSGLAIQPQEYVFETKKQDGSHWLIGADLASAVGDLDDRQRAEYTKIVKRGDLAGVRGWLQKHIHPERHARFVVQIQDIAFNILSKSVDDPNRRCEIELMTRDAASGHPYIPGSSIKGAVRTALIDALIGDPPSKEALAAANDARPSAKFEARVLGNTKNGTKPDLYRDPFRQLAFSDATLEEGSTYIDEIKIRRLRRSETPVGEGNDPTGIQMFREVTWSALDGEAATARGELRLFSGLSARRYWDRKERVERELLPRSWTIEELCQQCTAFYRPRLERELERFFRDDAATSKTLKGRAHTLEPNQALVRLGRHKHWECTVLRAPLCREPKRGVGMTRSLAGGMLPLGWAILSFEATG